MAKKKKSNVFLSITDEAQMSLGLKDPTQRLTWEGPLRDSALRDAQVSFAVNSNFNQWFKANAFQMPLNNWHFQNTWQKKKKKGQSPHFLGTVQNTPGPTPCLWRAFRMSSGRSVEFIHSWVCRCHSRDVLAGQSKELFVSSKVDACCLSRELPFLSVEFSTLPACWLEPICCLKP